MLRAYYRADGFSHADENRSFRLWLRSGCKSSEGCIKRISAIAEQTTAVEKFAKKPTFQAVAYRREWHAGGDGGIRTYVVCRWFRLLIFAEGVLTLTMALTPAASAFRTLTLTAFAEAEGPKGTNTRTWFNVKGQDVFAWGGLWRESAEWGPVYAGAMTELQRSDCAVHDRMPLLLLPDEYDLWLNCSFEDLIVFQERCFPDDLIQMTRTSDPWNKTRGGGVSVSAPDLSAAVEPQIHRQEALQSLPRVQIGPSAEMFEGPERQLLTRDRRYRPYVQVPHKCPRWPAFD